MEFVNPAFLYGLFALAVPIIIHLFNFRRFRKVYFTNVEFIQELKKETQKQSRLKHLLVLLARMLAVVALVLAFARPFIPVEKTIIHAQERSSVSIYVDNSFSMQAESEEGILMQSALTKAREVAEVYKSSDRFQLLTNDFEGRHQRFVSKEEFFDLLDEVELSPVVKNYAEIRARQLDLQKLEPGSVKSSYVLSDFQTHFLEDDVEDQDSLMLTYFIPVQAENTDNLYIDSCWFESPVQQLNQVVKLKLRIRNESANAYEDIPVKLTINDTQKALASFAVGPFTDKVVELVYTNTRIGIQMCELEINDYPVNFDDRFFFSYFVAEGINGVSINEESPSFYLNSLYDSDTAVQFENISVDQLDFSSVRDFEFVIFNGLQSISSGLSQEAIRFLNAGGSLVIFPPENITDDSYNKMLRNLGAAVYGSLDTAKQKVESINLDHDLYSGVFDDVPENMDLPSVVKHYNIQPLMKVQQENLLQLQNGNLFLSLFHIQLGKLYLSSVPLNISFSNFPRHPVFVPTLYKIAVSSITPTMLYYILGKDELIQVESLRRSPDEVMKIKDSGGSFEAIPEHRRVGHLEDLNVHGQIPAAGNYILYHADKAVKGLSFNYNRLESDMTFNSSDELKEIIANKHMAGVSLLEITGKPFAQALEDLSKGIQLWKWFILAALLFLMFEVLLLRFWK